MATTLGQLQEFNPDSDSFSVYVERVKLFFTVNDIAEGKRAAVFLNFIGARAYELLRSLLTPTLPQSLKYSEVVGLLREHYEPQPIVVAERFHFHRRNQREGESIAEYMAALRKLSTHCDFKTYLNEALRDRLVCGLRSESIQRRLLAEKELSLQKAMELSQGMEAANRNAKSLKGTSPAINKVRTVQTHKSSSNQRVAQRPSAPCHRCGRSNHDQNDCKFRDSICHNCQKKGHIAPVCRAKKRPTGTRNTTRGSRGSTPRTNFVSDEAPQPGRAPESEDCIENTFRIARLGESQSQPFIATMEINGTPLDMEIDTGALVSIISEQTREQLFSDIPVEASPLQLQTYTGERLNVLGQVVVQVRYLAQEARLALHVVAGNGPSLLGRDWLQHIRLDWGTVRNIDMQRHAPELCDILTRHSDIFAEELGKIEPFRVTLQVQSQAKPRFCKARSVPFAVKDEIEAELNRLESAGILVKVDHSPWAAPIVAVPQKDGKIRICGDYKVTVNQALEVDQYPLPKPKELFATLAGGQKFSKLDLSQAYQQLILDAESRKYVTINTHRGLYQYTRLPFGVASAPAIFQKTINTILQGIPNVHCYIDNILITGPDDETHLRNLTTVLDKLQQHGVRVKKSKCCFMANSVTYLGHKIDKEGLHTTNEKVDAVINAPEPRNLQQLRSFLGMVNYYRKFLPNLSTTLRPLNALLQKNTSWRWSQECKQAFVKAKSCVVEHSVLVHYNPDLPLRLAADASAYGIGAVISHVMPNGEERPIAFASRTLQPSECNYAQLEKEALALVFAIKKFHLYLYGRRFTLITDHKPLLAILGPKKGIPPLAAARLQRWALLLSAYNYELEFKSTEQHSNADGLSRLPLQSTSPLGDVPAAAIHNIRQIEALPITAQTVRNATRRDNHLSKVLQYTRTGWPSQIPQQLKAYSIRRNEITVEAGCLLWGVRVIIPNKLQPQLLKELHSEHTGASKMKSAARYHMWWPHLDQDIEKVARNCKVCKSVKPGPPAAPLHPWSWPAKPWQRVHVDFAGPTEGKSYLLLVDSHSK